jgi:hypothetical protein
MKVVNESITLRQRFLDPEIKKAVFAPIAHSAMSTRLVSTPRSALHRTELDLREIDPWTQM